MEDRKIINVLEHNLGMLREAILFVQQNHDNKHVFYIGKDSKGRYFVTTSKIENPILTVSPAPKIIQHQV